MSGPDPSLLLTAAGLLIGALFGGVVQATHFCTMGAVSDYVLFGSLRRLRVWALAIATALVGTQGLAAGDLVTLQATPYLGQPVFWLGAVLGGLLFGHGMVLAGGCTSRALVRLSGGSLKALLVLLVMAVTVLAVLTGPFATLTRGLAEVGSIQLGSDHGLPSLIEHLGMPPGVATSLATALLLAPLLAFVLADARFRHSPGDLAAGVALGAIVALGWALTSALGAAVPLSLNYVQPAGDGLLWLMTGAQSPGFAIGAVGGTILGAAVVAARTGQLRLETFVSRDDMVRHCLGGLLMGAGGALALGCTVGQGITGVSTLSLHALLALPAMLAGAWWGVHSLETGRVLPWTARAGAARTA